MGFGTTFAVTVFIIVFAGMSVMMVTMQHNMAESATELAQEQQRLREMQEQEISITSATYSSSGPVVPWTLHYSDEFQEGTLVNTTIVGDSIELAGTSTAGNYTSEAYDAGFESNFTTLSFSAVAPGGTVVQFQIRTANTTGDLLSEHFTGPNGSTESYYNVTGTSINSTHGDNRYIQYIAHFTTTTPGVSATLQTTTINVQRGVGHIFLRVDNSGSEKLAFDETDVYIEGLRINRTENARVLEKEVGADERLWNGGEELNITVFQNISSPTSVSIANSYAKDQTTVTP